MSDQLPPQSTEPQDPQTTSYREQLPAKKKPDRAAWLIALVLVAGIGGCSAWAASRGSTPSEADKHRDAGRVCKDFVKRQLKAPATAEFGTPDVTGSAGTYSSTGTVDAENSFGAKLRSTYTCQVHEASDRKNWVLDSLTGLGS
jgi:hypothetical protein